MEWYTIIVNDPKSFAGSYQLLYPNQWIKLANTGDVEGVLEDILKGSQLTELFDVSVNAALDGGDNNDVSVLSSYEPKKGEDKLDELFDADINLSLDGGTGNNVSVLSPLGGLGEELKEGLNNSEFAEYMQLCKEIGIKGNKDLESFMKEVGLEAGCDPHKLLDALREYRAELGPDFKIVNEETDVENITDSVSEEDKLSEGYKIDLPQIRVRDIKRELDLHGNITFNLPEPMDFTDERGWCGANDVVVVEKDNGEYECYYQWLDQDGDLLEPDSEADGYFENFEELLYWLDDYLVNIVDLEEYIGSEIMEGLKEAKGPEEETELRTQDPNEEPEDQPTEQEQAIEVDSKVLEESQSQEISSEYSRLSKKYGIDFEDLVYGKDGFMQSKYPGGFPDFDGDVIYSEKYFSELKDFMSFWKKANELITKSEARGEKLKRVPTDWLANEKIRREIENPAIKAKARFISPENNIYVFPEDVFNGIFNNKTNESLEDTIKRPEAPKDLSVVKEPGDPSISEGDLVWFNTHKGEDVVIQIIKFTKDPEGKRNGCRVVYTEPRVTRPHKEHW